MAATFAGPVVLPLGGAGTDLVAGRFGGATTVADGVAVRIGGTVRVFGLGPDGGLTSVSSVAFPTGMSADTVVAGDLNGDGLDDLELIGSASGYPIVTPALAGRSTSAFTLGVQDTLLADDDYNPAYAGQRAVYLPAGSADNGEPRVALFGSTFAGDYGTGTIGEGAPLSIARPAFNFISAGVDGTLDNGDLLRTFTGPSIVPPAVTDVVAGDFNGDGNADVAAVDASTGGVDYQITPDEPAGTTIDPSTIRHLATDVTQLATADVNGDGRADLIGWGGASADEIHIWYGQANGTLTAGPTLTLAGAVTAVVGADFDGDGHVDLATNLGVLPGRGNGTFGPIVALPTGTAVGSQLLATDVNGDGRPDLVALSPDGATLSVIVNRSTYAAVAPTVSRVTVSDPVPLGSPIRLTASVLVAAGTPTGTVTFYDGTTAIGTGPVDATGTATFVTSGLSYGAHTITARYGGDATFAASVSLPATAHVQRPTILAYYGPFRGFHPDFTREGVSYGTFYTILDIVLVNADGSPMTLGDLPTPGGGVTASLNGAVAGGGSFSDYTDVGGYYAASVSLFDFTYEEQRLPGGTYTLTATYAGDNDYAPSTLGQITVTIPAGSSGTSGSDDVSPTPMLIRPTTPPVTPSPTPTPQLTTLGSIVGTLFADANGNGAFDIDPTTDTDEVGLAGGTVYLDLNGNGRADAGEPTATTGGDGEFNFGVSTLGRAYAVRVVAPAGYTLTLPTAGPIWATPTAVDPAVSVLLGATVTGTVAPTPPARTAVPSPFGTNATLPSVPALAATATADAPAAAGHPASAAADSDFFSYYESTSADGAGVTLDLGASAPFVTELAYAPRPGFGARMIGGMFQASSSATFATDVTNLFTITAAPPDGTLSVVYEGQAKRYWRYVGPDGGYGDIGEFSLYSVPDQVPTSAAPPTELAAPGLTPAIARSTVPASSLAGVAIRGTVELTLTNTASAVDRGVNRVRVYAVPLGTADYTAGTLLRTVSRRLKLAVSGATRAAVPVVFPKTLVAGTYTLVAATTDAGGAVATVNGPTVTLVARQVYLVAAVPGVLPAAPQHGRPMSVDVAVINTGNAPTAGPVRVLITLVDPAGVAAPITERTAVYRRAIPGGNQQAIVRVTFRAPPAGQWTPGVLVTSATTDPARAAGSDFTVA